MSQPRMANRTRCPWVGVAFALLTSGLLAPAAARAGCAHDASREAKGTDHLPLLRQCGALESEAAARRQAPSSEDSRDRPGGCTGPSCSRRSGLPTTPTSFGMPRPGQWAVIEALGAIPSPGASRPPCDDGEARPILTSDAIFHPPRLAPVAD